jgi:type VI secretion system protein ImpC
LPLHVYHTGVETVATPCAEAVLTERAAERLLERGLSPLLSVRDSDAVMLPRLQSIAEPLARLSGRWGVPSHGDSD